MRGYWSEKINCSISLEYQQIHMSERKVRLLGGIPTNNKNRNVFKATQTKEVTMKKLSLKIHYAISLAVALLVFVGAGGAQYICARSNTSSL
jgi:hypothetical protein